MSKVIAVLAHVDAGKTTFSEQVLYSRGVIRAPGRVDRGTAFLDSEPVERERGITVFSGQAFFECGGERYFWLDTPGHADFSAETERAVSVCDCALIILSGPAGVQSHTEALWRLLERRGIPVFFFINKTDLPGCDLERVTRRIRSRLSADAVFIDGSRRDEGGDWRLPPEAREAMAERNDALLEAWMGEEEAPALWFGALREMFCSRRIFPVMTGAALRGEGVNEALEMLCALTRDDKPRPDAGAPFRARVYKVRHTAKGERVCFMRVMSGALHPRDEVAVRGGEGRKITELRLYKGESFIAVPEAASGDLVAVTGLKEARPGDWLTAPGDDGEGMISDAPFFVPMLGASVIAPPDISREKLAEAFHILEDEDPAMETEYRPEDKGFRVRTMGDIQLEILQRAMADRFGIRIDFGPPKVLLRETVAEPTVGIGHYEPLRHYAEAHLRLVPAPAGSGIRFVSKVHVDDLSLNWQRLIETHVFERVHKGVLTGSPLTDVTVELIAGRAHLKHTEGGDFREAVGRAMRNALMKGKSVLLEPVCSYEMTGPSESYGRIIGDLNRFGGRSARLRPPEAPVMSEETFTVTGEALFRDIAGYRTAFSAVTGGRGSLSWQTSGYIPSPDSERLIAEAAYDPLADDTPDSVFCGHGAGFTVAWDHVEDFAHLHP